MSVKISLKLRVRIAIEEFRRKYIPFGKKFRCEMYSLIGHHYFAKNNQKHSEAKKTLELIGISSVWYRRGYLYIKCARPGILIGKRGADIDALGEYIRESWFMKIPFKGIRVVEDREIGNLYNYVYHIVHQESEYDWDIMDDHWTDLGD